MAVLPDSDRVLVFAYIMRNLSDRRDACSITKADLKAAVDAADSWADSNSSSYNLALPQPARSALTSKQKAEILSFVIRRRYEVT